MGLSRNLIPCTWKQSRLYKKQKLGLLQFFKRGLRTHTMLDSFHKKHILITGGLGFIGSSLARRLVQLGVRVILVDSLIPEYGGNLFNIAGIRLCS
jgi:FlaA1/EpsC-like NDP-sugar epimerase